MPYSSEEIMPRILVAFGQGAGSATRLAPEALAVFRRRYTAWLEKIKNGNTKTPLDVWDDKAIDFEAKFREIGRRAAGLAGAGGAIVLTNVQSAATSVESDAPCPFCPPPDGWV